MQGVYQWLLAHPERAAIEAQLREMDGFDKADREHLDALLHGCIAEAAALDALLAPFLDRATTLLSPVEHAVLMIGTYELRHCLDVPYRVVINEAVELAKTYGGTDGHRYVNGVLDKAAAALRPAEVKAHAP
jgi:N utilization substance protein B